MNDSDIFDDFALETAVKDEFGVALEIEKIIARNLPVGSQAKASLFLSPKKQLYCYVYGHTKFTLSDVRRIAARIGVRIETAFPPRGRPQYFDEIGRERFREVFPGRHEVTPADLVYYRTLAPYSPALLLVSEVKDGTINQFDSDARGGWRPAVKFAYRRIKTS